MSSPPVSPARAPDPQSAAANDGLPPQLREFLFALGQVAARDAFAAALRCQPQPDRAAVSAVDAAAS